MSQTINHDCTTCGHNKISILILPSLITFFPQGSVKHVKSKKWFPQYFVKRKYVNASCKVWGTITFIEQEQLPKIRLEEDL